MQVAVCSSNATVHSVQWLSHTLKRKLHLSYRLIGLPGMAQVASAGSPVAHLPVGTALPPVQLRPSEDPCEPWEAFVLGEVGLMCCLVPSWKTVAGPFCS